jgi:hypothetical protein
MGRAYKVTISSPIENWANLRHEPHCQSRPLQGQVPELPRTAANGSWNHKFSCDISLKHEKIQFCPDLFMFCVRGLPGNGVYSSWILLHTYCPTRVMYEISSTRDLFIFFPPAFLFVGKCWGHQIGDWQFPSDGNKGDLG